MRIERIEEMRLTAADEGQIGRLLDAAFDSDFQGRAFYQNRHHVRFVARDGEQIIGHMALSLRAIHMGDQPVHVAGLAEVATAPSHRGQGIASAMMQAVIAEAKASIADFLVLFGDQPLYAGVGFEVQPNPLKVVTMLAARTGQIETRQDGKFMVMALRDVVWDDTADVDLAGFPF